MGITDPGKNCSNAGIFLLACLLPLCLFGQIEKWVSCYNGPGNGADICSAVARGADGSIYAAGRIKGDDFSDFGVIGLDKDSGDTNWVYLYDGPGNGHDEGWSIICGADGNIYATGVSAEVLAGDLIVISLDTAGGVRWRSTYDGPGSAYDEGRTIVYGMNGDLYIAGRSTGNNGNHDIVAISFDKDTGDTNWVYRYDGPGAWHDWTSAMIQGEDRYLYIAGVSAGSSGTFDFTVIKLDTTGQERWVYEYDGPDGSSDCAYSIVYGQDGNLYAAGLSTGIGTYYDFTVVSLDTAGGERWVYRYATDTTDCAWSIVQGLDGNIYAAGFNACFYPTVISLGTSGAERWFYAFPGSGLGESWFWSIIRGIDGNLYAGGWVNCTGAETDFLVVSLDQSGGDNWAYCYNGPGSADDRIYSIAQSSDGNLYLGGLSDGGATNYDFTVMSLSPATAIEEEFSRNASAMPAFFTPTFFQGEIRLEFTNNQTVAGPLDIIVYDILGRVVLKRNYAEIGTTVLLDDFRLESLGAGVYFLAVLSGDKNLGRVKLVKR